MFPKAPRFGLFRRLREVAVLCVLLFVGVLVLASYGVAALVLLAKVAVKK